jgi:putative endonuclease
MYYVYFLVSETEETYVGYTSDLRKRMAEHKSGRSFATKGKNWNLVYYEAYASKEDATKREWSLKRSGQAKRWLKTRVQHSMESFKS